jgi:tetratricopeptide (TPR) repeat protein
MSETLPINQIFATAVVVFSIVLLIYFAVKTLITSNLFAQGVNLYQQKDYQGAETVFRKVISLNSTNDVVRLMLGDALNQQGQVEAAKEWFNEVIRRSPKNPQGYLRLANVLMQENQLEAAKANLQQAQELLQKQRQPATAAQIANLLEKINTKANK